MAGNEKTVKFVRSLHPTTGSGFWSAGQASMLWMKVLYEFWGFCVHGGNNLQTPGVGAFASISGALAPNYLRMSPGFESGSTVLIMSGSDGSTEYGSRIFNSTSANFLSLSGSTYPGRQFLVTWKSGSTSTDDGIYPILQVLNSQSIVVDTNTAGTPMSASNYQPRFIDRSSINFRVIDLWGLARLTGYTQNDYMILQFNAQAINSGQAASQAMMRFFSGSIGTGPAAAAFVLSQSGSWNGTSFSDATPELVPDNFLSWFNSDADNIWIFNFFADQGAIVSHAMHGDQAASFNEPCNFHIEIPTRLFPQSKDPNPICCLNCCSQNGSLSIDTTFFFTTTNWSAGWFVANSLDNSAIRRYHPLVRNIFGSNCSAGALYDTGTRMGYIASGRFTEGFYNVRTQKAIIQDVVLAHRVTGSSYTMGRVQLRRAAWATGPYERMRKLGANGEWIAIAGGVLWPWDNANLPSTLFPLGPGVNHNNTV